MTKKASFYALGILVIALFINKLYHPDWKRNDYNAVFVWDNAGYYAYLPAVFIYNDIEMGFVDSLNVKYPMAPVLYMFHGSPTGKRYNMYPAGLAVLYSPFFLAAHASAYIFDYPPDGYSAPYKFFISWGAFFFGVLGLWLLRVILLRFFSEKVTAVTLIILVLGSNLFLYISRYSIIVHVPNFFVLAMAVLYTIKWHNSPGYKNSAILGACIGLATLVRPTDGLILLLPVLWSLYTKKDFLLKLRFLKRHLPAVLAAILACIAVGSIQLFYWKRITGSWFFFSYPGEWFDFGQPHLSDILFSYHRGWLLYSPLLLLAFYGLWLLYRKKHVWFLPLFAFIAISIYVIASWSNWWYGGGYGHRAFISMYAVLALPLAFAVNHLLHIRSGWRVVLSVTIGLMIILNLFQTWQYDNYINHMFRTNKQSYWKAFFATSKEEVDYSLLTPEFSDEEVQAFNIEDYSVRTLAFIDCTEKKDSDRVPFVMTKDNAFSPGYKEEFRYLAVKPDSWLRISAVVKPRDSLDLQHIAMTVSFENRTQQTSYKYFSQHLDKGRISGDSIKEISFRVSIPFKRFDDDLCKFYLYNFDGYPTQLEIYSLKVEVCDRKRY